MRPTDGWRRELGYLLQVTGLTGFAVVQPVLEVMGQSPETFIFRGAGPADIAIFGLLLAVIPAVVLWGLAAGTGIFGPRIRLGAHLVTMGILASVIMLQVLERVASPPPPVLIGTAVVAGGLVAWLLTRLPAVRTWTRWAAVAPLLSVLLFLFFSPVSRLLGTAEAGAVARGAAPVPVVMVVFDEFPLVSILDRSGTIDEHLYPNLAELASRSTWYPNYTVTEAGTRLSVPTILTGKRITDRSKQPVASDHPDNLFTLLSQSHQMRVFEPYTALCPAHVCGSHERDGRGGLAALAADAAWVWRELSFPGGESRDVTEQFDEPDDDAGAVPDAATAGLGDPGPFADLVRSLAPGEPTLYFLHSMLPHVPWKRFPDSREYDTMGAGANLAFAERGGGQIWVEEPWPVQLARQRHLLQVQYVDRLVGELVGRMEDVGLFDEALVVITSDHGGSTTPGQPRRSPTVENVHEILWVPLFVKAPGQRDGVVDERNLTALDLLPTIADLLGTEVPWPTEGTSTAAPGSDRGPRKTFRVFSEGEEAAETITILQEEAQRRLRRDAFAPEEECRPDVCPFLVGPGASLIGRSLDGSTLGLPSDRSATLVLPRDLRVSSDRPLPALVLGNLSDVPPGATTSVVVAMNGSVAGVSDTWTRNGVGGWFGVLVPPSLFRNGANDLQLFEMEGSLLRSVTIPG